MAQVRAAAGVWPGAHRFAAAVAAPSRPANLAGDPGGSRAGGGRRDVPTALVSRVSFVFDAAGFCHQPDFGPRGFVFVFHFHPDAVRIRAAAYGPRSVATQTFA